MTTEVWLLTQEGCNPCRRAKRILNDIVGENSDLRVREISLQSEEGMKLALDHGILYPPVVFINGKVVAKGKVREEDLRRELGALPLTRGIP